MPIDTIPKIEKYTLPFLAVLIILPRFIGLDRLALPTETNAIAALMPQLSPTDISPAEIFPFRAVEIAIVTTILLVLYVRLRPVHPIWAAFATLLIAWEPIFVAYSRLWQPEPIAAAALLLTAILLTFAFRSDDRALWQAGFFGGIALAAGGKFVPLMLISLVGAGISLRQKNSVRPKISVVERWLFWLMLTLVVWLTFSPAAWKNPAEFLTTALLPTVSSPTATPLWQILAVLSPVGLLGMLGALRGRKTGKRALWTILAAQIIFAGGWMFFQPENSPAAVSIVLLPMVLLAARGWWLWLESLSSHRKNAALAILAVVQLAGIGWSAPYLVTFTNPLWGNIPISAHWVDIPDSVGMDAAARWLNACPDALDGVVGTDTPQLLSPFYAGRLTAFTSPDAAFVVLTRAQQRVETPSPTILRYYDMLMEPEFSVTVRGQTMARVYRAPAVQRAMELPRGLDTGILPKPIAFRLNTDSPRRSETLTVDVIWLTPPSLPPTQSVLSMRSLIRFEADMVEAEDIAPPRAEIFAETAATLQPIAEGLVVSRHHLHLPADMPAGQMSLVSDGRPIGVVTVAP